MAEPTYQDLLDQNARQQARIAELEKRLADLEAANRQLRQELDEARRAAKRQAAPFSKGPPKEHPKPPGRKSGDAYGLAAHRPIPDGPPDEIVDVPLPPACPHCGGAVVEQGVAQQFQAEIPRTILHRRFDIHVGRCRRCGRRIQPRHPLQTSDALGAAASQLGPNLQAGIVHLNKQAGMSQGKIAAFFQTFFDLYVSRGGVCQAMLRAAESGQALYQAIVKSVPQAEWIVPDETGWRIGGHLAWMHGYVTPAATVYTIARGRGYEVAERIIGAGYAGKLVHDGWGPYDRFIYAWHQQCLNHLITRCAEMLAAARGRATTFPRQVRQLFWDALDLRKRRDGGRVSPAGLAVALGRLQARLDRLLAWTKTDPDNERLAKHLAKHRHQIFTFLKFPGLDATNYRAEQAMRPAVVNRKVWGGNRTERGAQAQSILMTLLETARRGVRDTMALFADLICGKPVHLAFLPAGP
jgi:transposase